MSTRSKMIRKAAQMPKGSQQRRLILHRLSHPIKQAARKKDEFQIVDASLLVRITQDDFEEGLIGGPNDSEYDKHLGNFKDFRSLLKGAEHYFNGDIAGMGWESEEDGRIDGSYSCDVEGYELTKRDEEEWRAGRGEAYVCDVTIYFRFARVWTPDESEITRMFKL